MGQHDNGPPLRGRLPVGLFDQPVIGEAVGFIAEFPGPQPFSRRSRPENLQGAWRVVAIAKSENALRVGQRFRLYFFRDGVRGRTECGILGGIRGIHLGEIHPANLTLLRTGRGAQGKDEYTENGVSIFHGDIIPMFGGLNPLPEQR